MGSPQASTERERRLPGASDGDGALWETQRESAGQRGRRATWTGMSLLVKGFVTAFCYKCDTADYLENMEKHHEPNPHGEKGK